MIQILLHGLKMDPLVSLHYYAPVCALINLAILPFTEGLAPFYELARLGPLILLSNAAVAFGLNVAAVFLVSAGSGLVLTLAGVFKVRTHTQITCRRANALGIDSETDPFIPFSLLGHPPYHGFRIDLRLPDHPSSSVRFVPSVLEGSIFLTDLFSW